MSSNKKLYLFNSFSRQREIFSSLLPNKVTFYVCGVTVYDHCHVGHARAYVAFDCIRRYLTFLGYDVTFIQNFTDIDDKIIARASQNNEPIEHLTRRFIASFYEDMNALNIQKATHFPRATNYVEKMISMIDTLIKGEYAYVTQSGDVYFSIHSYADYGRLSGKNIDYLESGHRVEIMEGKRHPLDFVLWKSAKPGEPFWESPWGKGRPGWHIECSAMATDMCGETIDIHAGGADLIFPHHENEIAQSECATGKKFANYWLHNGFVTIKDQKMSKSSGNFFTIRDLLSKFSGEVIRFFLMKMHYRSQLQFSFEGLNESKQALFRLHTTLKEVTSLHPCDESKHDFYTLVDRFHNAMCDDFNYTEAIGVLFELNKLINITQSGSAILRDLGRILGLFFTDETAVTITPEIQAYLDQRQAAKKMKDYKKSDEIRDLLENKFDLGIKDTRSGVSLFRLNKL